MAETRDSLDRLLEEGARRLPAKPEPGGWYSPEGDCVFFYREDVSSFAEWVDGLFTVYRAEDGGRIIGAQIKGISKLPPHDLLMFRVRENRGFEMVELLVATFYRQPQREDPDRLRKYDEASSVLRGRIPVESGELLRS